MFLPLFFGTRFAPRCPQSLELPFRGAKSSQKIRAASWKRPAFRRRDLLPAARKALRLRSGEQNLHRDSAPPLASVGPFCGAICFPLPAKPCGFVSGSKIFTEIPRRFLEAADHVGAAPPANAYATVGPRQQGAPKPACRPIMLAPPRRQPHMPPSGPANRVPQNPPAGRSCWRRPAGNPICHRRTTPTGRPGYEGNEKDCRYVSILKSRG